MELTLADIDPAVAESLQRTNRFRNAVLIPSVNQGGEAPAVLPRWWTLTGWALLSIVSTLVLVWTHSPVIYGVTLCCGVFLFTAIIVARIRRMAGSGATAASPTATVEPTLTHWLWEWLLRGMLLPPEQRAYTELVTALWQAAESGALAEEEAHAIIGDLNALAAVGRSLEARERRLIEEQQAHDSGAVTAERERLAARRDAATDDQAREAFAQGVELLDGRLARAAELARLRERVEAERAVCAQAFASLQASLLSLGGGGAAAETDVLRAAVGARTTAARLVGRVRAAEEAAREVAALHAGAAK